MSLTGYAPGYAERLEEAREARSLGMRALAARLQERFPGRRGTSYGTVRAYLQGDIEHPTAEILELLAEVLDIDVAWVITGEGSMTRQDDAHGEIVGGLRPVERKDPEKARALADTVRRAIAGGAGLRDPNSFEVAFLATVWRQVRRHVRADDVEVAESVGRAAMAPVKEMGIDLEALSEEETERYFLAVTSALHALGQAWRGGSSDKEGGA